MRNCFLCIKLSVKWIKQTGGSFAKLPHSYGWCWWLGLLCRDLTGIHQHLIMKCFICGTGDQNTWFYLFEEKASISWLLLLFSHQVTSNSLRPHGLQHVRLPCPALSPWVCPLSQGCHPTISSAAALSPLPDCAWYYLLINSTPHPVINVTYPILKMFLSGNKSHYLQRKQRKNWFHNDLFKHPSPKRHI